MDFWLLLVLSAACGGIVKLSDSFADNNKKGLLGIALGITYGLMIGYLSLIPEAATIFIAAVLASAIAGKIDKKEHMAGIIVLFFIIFITGMKIYEVWLLIVFAIAAYIDESKPIKGYRGVLDIMAILAGIAGLGWGYAFFILTFDAGYVIASAIYPEKASKKVGRINAKRK